MKKSSSERHGLPVIHDRAAGIDIGSRFHVVAVPADITEEPVQTFKAFTAGMRWTSSPSWRHWSRHLARISPASTAYSPRMQTCVRS